MCPEPHVGLCLDVLLEHTHILLAVAELLAFDGLDGVEGYLIVAAANTTHAAVDEVASNNCSFNYISFISMLFCIIYHVLIKIIIL